MKLSDSNFSNGINTSDTEDVLVSDSDSGKRFHASVLDQTEWSKFLWIVSWTVEFLLHR